MNSTKEGKILKNRPHQKRNIDMCLGAMKNAVLVLAIKEF